MYDPPYIHSICAYNKYFYDYTTAFRCSTGTDTVTHRLPINTARLDYLSPFTVYAELQNEINTLLYVKVEIISKTNLLKKNFTRIGRAFHRGTMIF